jgi:hypothetical protein
VLDFISSHAYIGDVGPCVCACIARHVRDLEYQCSVWHFANLVAQLKEQNLSNLVAQQQKELLNLLMHATHCRATSSDPCSYPKCLQIKRLFCHARKCSIRSFGGCQHCQKVWYLLKLHAGICRQTDCRVPRCMWVHSFHFQCHFLITWV